MNNHIPMGDRESGSALIAFGVTLMAFLYAAIGYGLWRLID